jgi:putative transposase
MIFIPLATLKAACRNEEGYYISTVGKHGDETTLSSYVRKQSNDKTYKALHHQQLKLWG